MSGSIHWDDWLRVGAPQLDAERVNPHAASESTAGLETIHSPRDAVEQLGATVWRFLRQLGVATPELEDLHQEVFVTAIAKWTDFRGQSLRKSWVLGIALNKARNQMRQYRRQRFREALMVDPFELDALTERGETPDFSGGAAGDPIETVARRQAAQFVERTLSVLSEEERAVFLLVVVEGLGVPDVAPVLDLGSRRVHTILERVRRVFDAEIRQYLAQKPVQSERSLQPWPHGRCSGYRELMASLATIAHTSKPHEAE